MAILPGFGKTKKGDYGSNAARRIATARLLIGRPIRGGTQTIRKPKKQRKARSPNEGKEERSGGEMMMTFPSKFDAN